MTDLDFFTADNANLECRSEHLSASGQYRLVTTPFSTRKGCWNYTQGLVFKVGSDQPIADVRRNYSSFPFTFIEDHPNVHQYLVCGADYQGQTVIELDTGRRRDFLPEAAKKGAGFCWADYQFDPESQLLIVDGCFWACPYEYRFFDFSDPMEKGWPELRFDGAYAEDKWPEIVGDLVRCYEVEPEPEDAEEDVPVEERGWSCIRTFRRHGDELRFVSMWLSQAEQERRLARAEGNRKYKAWEKEFSTTDPLFLTYKELLKDPVFSPEAYEGRGITYEGWCPGFTEQETRWSRRIIADKSQPYTVELEWGVKTGPVKLQIYKDGKTHDSKFFEHSVEGMGEAFAYAKSLLTPTILQRLTRLWGGHG